MKIKILPIFLFLVLLIIFLIFYKGLQNSNIYVPKTYIKKDIPIFEAKIFDTNEQINSENIFKKKKFYLINIWASWCAPCREEHIFLNDLNRYENIEIIGINYKDQKKNAKKFLKELANPYDIILFDDNGTLSIEWGAYGVPETFLIYDKQVIKKIVGPLDEGLFLEIKELIK